LDYTGIDGGAPGRIRTDTESGLSRLPLLVGLQELQDRKGPGGRSCTRIDSVLSGVPLLVGLRRGNMVLTVGIAPTTRRFEAGRSNLLSYGSLMKWCARTVLPRLLRNVGAAIC
jgi:hypothetical protein